MCLETRDLPCHEDTVCKTAEDGLDGVQTCSCSNGGRWLLAYSFSFGAPRQRWAVQASSFLPCNRANAGLQYARPKGMKTVVCKCLHDPLPTSLTVFSCLQLVLPNTSCAVPQQPVTIKGDSTKQLPPFAGAIQTPTKKLHRPSWSKLLVLSDPTSNAWFARPHVCTVLVREPGHETGQFLTYWVIKFTNSEGCEGRKTPRLYITMHINLTNKHGADIWAHINFEVKWNSLEFH